MNRDVFALMVLVGQFRQIDRKVIAYPVRPLPWSLADPCWLPRKTTAQSQTLPTARVTHHSHREIPRERNQYFQYAWNVGLAEVEYPGPLEVRLVVAMGVFELVMSTSSRHVDIVFDVYHEVSINNVIDLKETLPLTVKSTRTYFLPILRSQGTSFSVSAPTSLTLPIR